ncbi:MAG: trans-2,3-dihydro-3-hydroxyanthranilic acid synthase [Pseudonocardiales bacterium]|jgi:bifunctional isochorismate lyase/aryl carrier protein|nr:trans-2,3-dihydro-3-hydroxyanthranilic acid synthase [Pseudonocardiales bacterium]
MTQTWDAAVEIDYDPSVIAEDHVRRTSWQVDPARAVLLVHDMQHYFLRRFRRDRQPAMSLMRNVETLVRDARSRSMPIVYTAQNGGMTAAERGLLAAFWGPGMVAEAADREIPEAFAPRAGDRVLTKWRYSAFHRTDLLELMRSAGRDQIVITGVYGHVGIQTTAVDAYSHDIETFVVADAIADFSAAKHRQTLSYLADTCAVVLPAAEVHADLDRPTTADLVGSVPKELSR